VLDPDHEETRKVLNAPIRNWRGTVTGYIRPVQGLTG